MHGEVVEISAFTHAIQMDDLKNPGNSDIKREHGSCEMNTDLCKK